MQLPDDYKTRKTTLAKALYVSAASPAGKPFSPYGVSVAMETEDGTRYAAVLTERDAVIRLVETILKRAEEVWPEMESQGDPTR